MLYLQPDICEEIKGLSYKKWTQKRVRYECRPRSWSQSRLVQISTPIAGWDICYIYCEGYVSLSILEGSAENHYDLIRYLQKTHKNDGIFNWHEFGGMKQGFCSYEVELSNIKEIIDAFDKVITLFDPVINSFIDQHSEIYPTNSVKPAKSYSYNIKEGEESYELKTWIASVGELTFKDFTIPPYQRPYKWTVKNVNQLISDLLEFSSKNSYRLGTLVLHKGEIVDGQQRLVTLSLLLTFLFEKYGDNERFKNYKDFGISLKSFCDNIEFPNPYSIYNVVENMNAISSREEDLSEDVLAFILSKCTFVVVQLSNISEAFQFFDSQNARGKDLVAHDLLKAFHLREMPSLTNKDTKNIDDWQRMRTDDLSELFLVMFRTKKWPLGKSARYFSKDDIDTFKGVSINSGKRYPFYQLEIIAHVYIDYYMSSPDRIIDNIHCEYPFNLDDQIVNGSRFFDMVRHYSDLYAKIFHPETFSNNLIAKSILDLIGNYKGCNRDGDIYVKQMFYTDLLYYIDRFGFEELDKIVPKLFIWAYTLRLSSQAVQRAAMDNYARGKGENISMFKVIHESRTPYDIINVNLECLDEAVCTQCDEVKDKFVEIKKLIKK